MARINDESHKVPKTSRCTKYSLFLLNTIFWFSSVFLLGVCTFILYDGRKFYSEISSVIVAPVIVVTVVALLMFFITFLGCLGALRENTKMLTIYRGILVLLVLLEIGSGAMCFVFGEKIKKAAINTLLPAIEQYRDNPHQQELIDTIQENAHCCGLNGPDDWELNLYFNCSSRGFEACGVPHSCCKKSKKIINGVFNAQCGLGVRDTKSETVRAEFIYNLGCVDFLKNNVIILASVCTVVFLLQLLSIFLATILRSDVQSLAR